MSRVDSYVLIGELQFYNCLNCPWSTTAACDKAESIEVEDPSLQRSMRYIYLTVENMYELEVTAGENIVARSTILGISIHTVLVATRKRTCVNGLLPSFDSFKNKTKNGCRMISVQKQMKRTVFDYRMPLHPKKQILTQGESKTNNLANIDILSLLQYLRKGSDISETERFMSKAFPDRDAEEIHERYKGVFDQLILPQLDSLRILGLYPILKQLYYIFGPKFISYSYHEIVLDVAKEHLVRHLQKLTDLMCNPYCHLLCIKELHFFMKFHRYLHNNDLFKIINKSQVKADMNLTISKTRSYEMYDCMMFLREAPKFLCPLSLLCKRSCSDVKSAFFMEFKSLNLDNCIARPKKCLQKSTPFRTSSYFVPANFTYSETQDLKQKPNLDRYILQDPKYHKNEQISERICNMLSCQSISFTRWNMIESISDIVKLNYHDVCNLKVTSNFPPSKDELIATDSISSLVTWSDIGGLDAVKQLIRTTIELPTLYNKLFKNRNKGMILYGPPGTGKTLLARAISHECQLKFFMIKGPEVIDMYVGESERHLRQIFLKAKIAAPSILFFDELDAVASNRIENGNVSNTSRVVSQLILEIDDVLNFQNIFIMGATNRPDRIDSALLRPGRFDKLIYVGVDPSVKGKVQILKSLTRRMKLAPELDFCLLAETHASRYSGADLYSVCADSWLRASKRCALRHRWSSDLEVVVETEDFISSFANLKPSLSQELIEYYEDLNGSFI